MPVRDEDSLSVAAAFRRAKAQKPSAPIAAPSGDPAAIEESARAAATAVPKQDWRRPPVPDEMPAGMGRMAIGHELPATTVTYRPEDTYAGAPRPSAADVQDSSAKTTFDRLAGDREETLRRLWLTRYGMDKDKWQAEYGSPESLVTQRASLEREMRPMRAAAYPGAAPMTYNEQVANQQSMGRLYDTENARRMGPVAPGMQFENRQIGYNPSPIADDYAERERAYVNRAMKAQDAAQPYVDRSNARYQAGLDLEAANREAVVNEAKARALVSKPENVQAQINTNLAEQEARGYEAFMGRDQARAAYQKSLRDVPASEIATPELSSRLSRLIDITQKLNGGGAPHGTNETTQQDLFNLQDNAEAIMSSVANMSPEQRRALKTELRNRLATVRLDPGPVTRLGIAVGGGGWYTLQNAYAKLRQLNAWANAPD